METSSQVASLHRERLKTFHFSRTLLRGEEAYLRYFSGGSNRPGRQWGVSRGSGGSCPLQATGRTGPAPVQLPLLTPYIRIYMCVYLCKVLECLCFASTPPPSSKLRTKLLPRWSWKLEFPSSSSFHPGTSRTRLPPSGSIPSTVLHEPDGAT